MKSIKMNYFGIKKHEEKKKTTNYTKSFHSSRLINNKSLYCFSPKG